MRTYPEDENDQKDLERLNAETWMVECLKLNPDYVFWGPHEDYMWKEGQGWDSAVLVDSWTDMKFELDDLNEVVNFYFQVNRESVDCATCAGKGVHPDAQWISESWYAHSSPFKHQTSQDMASKALMERFGSTFHNLHKWGSFPSEDVLKKYHRDFRVFCEHMRLLAKLDPSQCHWSNKLEQEEVDALVEAGRLSDLTSTFITGEGWKKNDGIVVTPEMVNEWAKKGFGHDSINSWVAIKARCKKWGIPHTCPTCDGHGQTFTEPGAHLTLVLWVLHPRKGCSRGVEVKRVEKSDLDGVNGVYSYLRQAAVRNAKRFSKIPGMDVTHKWIASGTCHDLM